MNRNFYNNPNIGRDAYPRARGTGSYMTQLRQNGEQFSLTTFSDQVNKLKILMDVLDKSKMAVKNKKVQFERFSRNSKKRSKECSFTGTWKQTETEFCCSVC
ncbi:hypothetical protein MHBO_001348 [Bonamia ostreae]|uniref:LAGLIDADG homing endonuclease n=1 Tax=Bonamia ostreae TaxID=126728 RepID=A0ABV2AIM7_9EUKA